MAIEGIKSYATPFSFGGVNQPEDDASAIRGRNSENQSLQGALASNSAFVAAGLTGNK